ncbi:selenocysteine-specific translation elongation factor SelB [Bacillus oleivorans]|uniref:Selenocysteine-specific elongation factor n=1 Tax=Bacillus oleivorans TaxID=1448271 RepID=A0A285D6J8_9BACI|nr:selenocysteine-specific translation elongation factor [Bacillus oleivorans]SNX74956.1 selenocysteine-specific translation elongation factor SelB [Bacillus oleivorans]
MKRYYTIGMAGHIDHGKTALTKALTNVETDRLKEEKERKISIEPGFASFVDDDDFQISIVDVPGHERFIRQMIAGVAGIDLVILVVAADEGVMPQTVEHLDILSFLGIRRGIIAITKADKVEPSFLEIAKEEIVNKLRDTPFENTPCVCVDSLSYNGIEALKTTILDEIANLETKSNQGNFRLPVDQVFTIKGQGTVVRGTIFNGEIKVGQDIWVLPQKLKGLVRSIQVHHQTVEKAEAGQRAALNLSGISRDEIKRGNVIVQDGSIASTKTIDVSLRFVANLKYPVKQRMLVNCHAGTSEVMGTIVFFDRNEVLQEAEGVLCQIRLQEPIVVKRGDPFILRRPTPVETIAGGWILDPFGKKYKWGQETISALALKKEGTVAERMKAVLLDYQSLTPLELANLLQLDIGNVKQTVDESPIFHWTQSNAITLDVFLEKGINRIVNLLQKFHSEYPLRLGIDKAQLMQELESEFKKDIVETVLQNSMWTRVNHFIKLTNFKPYIPREWENHVRQLLHALERDRYQVKTISEYFDEAGIPSTFWNELLNFLDRDQQIIRLNENLMWTRAHFKKAVQACRKANPEEFTIADVKKILPVTRKYLIPFLVLLDQQGYTKRQENKRMWLTNS